MRCTYRSGRFDNNIVCIKLKSHFLKSHNNAFCVSCTSFFRHKYQRNLFIFEVWKEKNKLYKTTNIVIIAQSCCARIFWYDCRCTTEVFSCWRVEVCSSGTLYSTTVITEIVNIDMIIFNIFESECVFGDISQSKVSVYIFDYGIIEFSDF